MVTSLENKVDVMFQIVQEHANTANSGGGGVGPTQGDLANDIGIPESVMNLQPEGANFENTQESVNNVEQHNEVIEHDDESDNDDDDDSDDSDDYSENNDGETNLESTLKVVDMNETNDPNQLIQVSDDDDDDDEDSDDDDDDDESDYENNNEGALPNPNLVISGSLMEPDMVNLEENDPGIVDVVDLPIDATIPDDSIKTLNIGEDVTDEQSLAESDDSNLNKMQVSQLRDIAKEKGIKGVSKMKKKRAYFAFNTISINIFGFFIFL